jgi:hypothetical protein
MDADPGYLKTSLDSFKPDVIVGENVSLPGIGFQIIVTIIISLSL